MGELAAEAARAVREVAPFDERHPQSPRRGIERDTGTGDAASDDDKIDRFATVEAIDLRLRRPSLSDDERVRVTQATACANAVARPPVGYASHCMFATTSPGLLEVIGIPVAFVLVVAWLCSPGSSSSGTGQGPRRRSSQAQRIDTSSTSTMRVALARHARRCVAGGPEGECRRNDEPPGATDVHPGHAERQNARVDVSPSCRAFGADPAPRVVTTCVPSAQPDGELHVHVGEVAPATLPHPTVMSPNWRPGAPCWRVTGVEKESTRGDGPSGGAAGRRRRDLAAHGDQAPAAGRAPGLASAAVAAMRESGAESAGGRGHRRRIVPRRRVQSIQRPF